MNCAACVEMRATTFIDASFSVFLHSVTKKKAPRLSLFLRSKKKTREAEFVVEEEVLGTGTFGSVFVCRRGEEIFAEKVVGCNACREVEMLKKCANAPYTQQLVCSFRRSESLGSKTSLVLRYAPNGNLNGRMASSPRRARIAAAQLASALTAIHARNVVHRDLKPANVLVDSDGHLVLADFGLATNIRDSFQGFCGSLDYSAPEILRAGVGYGVEVDWWALGCVVFVLVQGKTPFAAPNTRTLFHNILHSEPEKCNDLVDGLLVKSPSRRLDDHSWKSTEWLQTIDLDAVRNRTIEPPFPTGEMASRPSSSRMSILEDSPKGVDDDQPYVS